MFKFLNQGFSNLFYKARSNFSNFWSTKDITKKILYTLVLLTLYIIGTTITTPFIKINLGRSLSNNTFFDTLNLVGGGGLQQFSLMALGISPFINASLIMMVLQTKLFPPIYKLSQSGPQGRRKINIITRFITVIIAYPQAVFLVKSLSAGNNAFISVVTNGISVAMIEWFYLPIILLSASLFALFISEQITNKGIGNGTSLIIFSGIAMRLPAQFRSAFNFLVGDYQTNGTFVGIINFGFYLIVYFAVILIISVVYNAERHVPIQQVGAGRSKHIKEMGKLPIKLNPGGVMPVIFAMMVISFPNMIANILPDDNYSKAWIIKNLQFTEPLGLSLLIVITFVFSILMGIQQSRVDKIAEDFAKSGTFIPGVRPGEDTQDYLIGIVFRLSIFSGIYLVLLASMQYFMIIFTNIPPAITFGGTGLMILVSVSLETWSQLKARNKTTRLAKAKRVTRANFDVNSRNGNGLLW
ncbi:preprotein translocase subunit SecY [Mycoplasmopsis ciconiae]|uniref:preprotein translocase subunit SecY n=1 Tax=Mycoplasmopsis ciconiae TaxID=561067 RepID=UPI0038B2E143